ncbi:hypothetical protein QYE76_049228 [Lolium multiflorum]|uniref:SIAH-type domain-containing protein n=1 Tax=Lolium multiflorum TaxID=4521 RepID=A0AAD8SNV1_LOLMU|nr:hypothetical protein QYE76_049228 [Lolium multiflorum]
METGDQNAKKPRLERPRSIRVKQEVAEHEGTGGEGGGAEGGEGEGGQGGAEVVGAATETGRRVEGAVQMDMTLLQCPLCSSPLRPPVFQCKAGHLACGGCCTESCRRCDPHGGGGFDVRNTAMDAVVSAARVECPHGGCETYIAYHDLDDHRAACPHAPCFCTESGCGFAGLAPALAAHLSAEHAWPTLTVQYGKVYRHRVLVPSQLVLVGAGDDGGGVFVLTAGALGGATAVSVVCVRASAAPWPRYTCKMWANFTAVGGANGDKAKVGVVDMKLESSTSPGAVVAVDELASFLTVPPRYLVPAVGVASMVVPLSIRIDRSSSSSP